MEINPSSVSFSPFINYQQLDHCPKYRESVPVKCPKCGLIKSVMLSSHLQTIKKK
jgi:hypothetical protein